MRVDLPGVGRNLQDRYEVGVTHRMREPWEVLEGARFDARRPAVAPLAAKAAPACTPPTARRSAWCARSPRRATAEPDLFCMALLARFEGYYPGYLAS